MNEQERRDAIWRLYNPQTPDPFVAADYGVLYRDLPPAPDAAGAAAGAGVVAAPSAELSRLRSSSA